MVEEIHSPLRDYREIYRNKFREAAERTFQEFAKAANVDVHANRQTVKVIRSLEGDVKKVKRNLRWLWVLCITLWVVALGSFTLWILDYTEIYIPIAIAVAIALLEFFYIHRKISKTRKRKKTIQQDLNDKIKEAYNQMEPLHSLYDEDVFSRLVKEVIPIVSLAPYLSVEDMRIFTEDLGWQYNSSSKSAAVSLQSGKINGNPFLITRQLVHTMGTKTYTGTKTVSVTKTRRVNGRTETYTTTETLTAHVTKPFPEYSNHTELIYGNQSAPELKFTRKKNSFKYKEGSLSFKFVQWKLKRKAANMNQDFALMTNEEFEVLFTTTDRTSNQQYALLFTPVAQANMIDLIRDEEKAGYGDDFNFYKDGRINTIVSDHMQGYNLEWSPSRFRQYEYDKAKEVFINVTSEAFRGIYFALAPLLCIPIYQQMHPHYDVRMNRPLRARSHPLQHEVLAYYWGQDRFKHSDCATNCILKTSADYNDNDGVTTVNVTSHGYRSIPRVTYVTVSASDGSSHSVPVHWDEYLPVEGGGQFCIKETDDDSTECANPKERLNRASARVKDLPGYVVFRHIATRLVNSNH